MVIINKFVQTITPSSLALASGSGDYVLLQDVSEEQVLNMLNNLALQRLVPPFKHNRINGRHLLHVESIKDLIDFDEEVKPVFAKTFFHELKVWKNNGNKVPVALLVAHSEVILSMINLKNLIIERIHTYFCF